MAPLEQHGTPSITAMLLRTLHNQVHAHTNSRRCMRDVRVITIMTSAKGEYIIHERLFFGSFSTVWVTGRTGKVGHIRGEHTSCVSCQCLSAVIGSIPGPVRSFVSWHGSHLLPFALSVKPLIPPIHLPGPAALSPSVSPTLPEPSLPA